MGDAATELVAAPALHDVLEAMHSLGHVVFADRRGFDLNIIGIRSRDLQPNTFNDWLTVSYLTPAGTWCYFAFPATTDPGLYYRTNPMNPAGTAIMMPGQYRGAYQIGVHGDYAALQQVEPIEFARDVDRDSELDLDAPRITDRIAANIHRASASQASTRVGRWSAGCQVIADPVHFAFLMDLCRWSASIFGDRFTYTLLDERQLR